MIVASKVAKTFNMSLNQAQNRLKKFEQIGLLVSRPEGTARMFYYKKSPVTDELRKFLRTMLDALPKSTIQQYYRERRRPRRYGKR